MEDEIQSPRQRQSEDDIQKRLSELEQIYRTAPVGLCFIDTEFRYIRINERLAAFNGKPASAHIGRTVREVIPKIAPTVEPLLRRVLETGEPVLNLEIYGPKASEPEIERVWLIEYYPLKSKNGSVKGITAVILDITARKRAEEQLQKSEAHNRALLNATPDTIFQINKDGVFLSWKGTKDVGLFVTPEQFLGKHISEVLPPDVSESALRSLNRALQTNKTQTLEYRLPANGRTQDFEARFAVSGENEAIIIVRDITERKRAEAEIQRFSHELEQRVNERTAQLQQSEERFRSQYEGIPLPTYSWQLTGDDFVLIDCNDAAREITHGGIVKFLGKTAREIFPDRPDIVEEMWRSYKEKTPFKREYVMPMRTTGKVKRFAVTGTFIPPDLLMVHSEDITERALMQEALREKEEQLRQAQKMEAIGQLAGGVAHDFNNLLTGIIGYSDLLREELGRSHPLDKMVQGIRESGEQAASLTNQLLAFSRKQVLQLKVIDLNEIVTGMEDMLYRMIGEDIELVTNLDPELGQTKVDPDQIKQIILNLATNARDAMPEGGSFTLATENKEIEEGDVERQLGATVDHYVVLSVSDTGSGMDEEKLAHAFEPFFTTKEVGKGTGLGLASVYGIVKQSGGYIQVSSDPGIGTKFQIYFPRVSRTIPEHIPPAEIQEPPRGTETILLVEDAIQVRQMISSILKKNGYTVLGASNGAEALQIAKKSKQPIRLLLSDMVMPGMSGPELAEQLTVHRKDMEVLFISGYAAHPLVQNRLTAKNRNFLSKPFKPETLLRKVRELLDAQKGMG